MFKVGDKVRRRGEFPNLSLKLGEVYKVAEAISGSIRLEERNGSFLSGYFELVEEVKTSKELADEFREICKRRSEIGGELKARGYHLECKLEGRHSWIPISPGNYDYRFVREPVPEVEII